MLYLGGTLGINRIALMLGLMKPIQDKDIMKTITKEMINRKVRERGRERKRERRDLLGCEEGTGLIVYSIHMYRQ